MSGKVKSVRQYDDKTAFNWLCWDCGAKFGMIPDSKGVVTCFKCGNTNNRYSQYENLKNLSDNNK